jgi:acetyl-CoA C-acetyltransferase
VRPGLGPSEQLLAYGYPVSISITTHWEAPMPTPSTSVIVAGARTPMGRLSGSLKGFSATDLGGIAIKGAMEKSGVSADDVDYVIMGHVIQAGAGQNPARQAAVKGGIGMDVPALTVNKVCLSGITAIALADQLVRAGEYDVVVAGGMESMSQGPHILPGTRDGFKYGDVAMQDSTAFDALTCAIDEVGMGVSTETHNKKYDLTREEQDAFSAQSHQRAAAAAASGVFDEEIVAVEIPQRKADPIIFEVDEGVRASTTAESLARLRPAFAKEGTITAGSSSQISDGAAAVVVMSKTKAEELGIDWLAEIGAHGVVSGPDASLQEQPANAILKACEKQGIEVDDLDLFELNEAFAAVGIVSARKLGVDQDIVNVNGGAIAMGHPVGMSGARLVLHVALELKRRGGGVGAAALCGGGGQGDALIVSVPA